MQPENRNHYYINRGSKYSNHVKLTCHMINTNSVLAMKNFFKASVNIYIEQ